jgi:hypothetical protein
MLLVLNDREVKKGDKKIGKSLASNCASPSARRVKNAESDPKVSPCEVSY